MGISAAEKARIDRSFKDAFEESGGRRRRQIDNESLLSITGMLSSFWMKDAYQYGWETELNRQDSSIPITVTDPRPTVTKIAIGVGVVIVGLFGAALGAIFLEAFIGMAVAVAVGTAAGAVLGALCGAIDAWLENGKLKSEITQGEKEAGKEIRHARAEEKALQTDNEIGTIRQELFQMREQERKKQSATREKE